MLTLLTTLHSKYIHASLALPCLAAACASDCGEVRICEFTVHEPKEQILAVLLAQEPDVIAFSVYIWNRSATLELIDALAVVRPQLRIVVGGPELSYEESDLLHRHPGISALIRGEGEIPFPSLLAAWARGENGAGIPNLLLRCDNELIEGPFAAPADDLDTLPSPFAAGQVDLRRGLVYYESSRGCPYNCAFCMSALDPKVRSFSLARIQADLKILLEAGVPQIKFVDRTFNYNGARSRAIWSFILQHNRKSHFHFEIGAHLLDEASLILLATVPPETFQFEIGVQSTLPATLAAISRNADLEKLERNVRRLRSETSIHLHLDLIYGLPAEGYDDFLHSLDRVATLHPHALQIEPVKLLPGAPLRRDAASLGIAFDPHPPYSVLSTPLLDFNALEKLRGISRLLDLLVNSHKFSGTIAGLTEGNNSLAASLAALEAYWRQHDYFRHPVGLREVFLRLADYLRQEAPHLLDALARDLLGSERIAAGQVPWFVNTDLNSEEAKAVREQVRLATDAIRGQRIKLQHTAAVFAADGRIVRLFLYYTAPGQGLEVREEVVIS
ncbi:MAG: B12-binding domain-containing radical SAM protein [Deltaproteobacteria bacterium HGW-Deltaproteobacteria-4]|nr:MAG: B12-binding domain-containing radical SAM protein [Deltaproteobacteria bacterium HGW-Deltaproteobacteria-4]